MRSIFRSWMHSPGHRENILGPYEEIGIGLRIGRLEGNARRPRLDPGLRRALLTGACLSLGAIGRKLRHA